MSDENKTGSNTASAHAGAGCADCSRRNLLVATAVVGGAAGVGAAVPFIGSFTPSERAKAIGAPVEVDISALQPGQMTSVEWQGKPVWIIRRTKEQLAELDKDASMLADPDSKHADQPAYIKGPYRSIKPEYMICVGVCTHLGCSPTAKFVIADTSMGPGWPGGFLCPCHGSTFDMAGRVFKNKPAPDNLPIPPHHFLTDTRILIGEDAKA